MDQNINRFTSNANRQTQFDREIAGDDGAQISPTTLARSSIEKLQDDEASPTGQVRANTSFMMLPITAPRLTSAHPIRPLLGQRPTLETPTLQTPGFRVSSAARPSLAPHINALQLPSFPTPAFTEPGPDNPAPQVRRKLFSTSENPPTQNSAPSLVPEVAAVPVRTEMGVVGVTLQASDLIEKFKDSLLPTMTSVTGNHKLQGLLNIAKHYTEHSTNSLIGGSLGLLLHAVVTNPNLLPSLRKPNDVDLHMNVQDTNISHDVKTLGFTSDTPVENHTVFTSNDFKVDVLLHGERLRRSKLYNRLKPLEEGVVIHGFNVVGLKAMEKFKLAILPADHGPNKVYINPDDIKAQTDLNIITELLKVADPAQI